MKQDQAKLIKVCNAISAVFPEPKTELNYTNQFTLLIAIILSAQTTDKMVNKATKNLFPIIPTPRDVIELGIDKLKQHLRILNYYNTKARNIIKMSEMLILENKNTPPQDLQELLKLPGVGRKTANVFLNIAHNMPTIAVDTHVFRTTNRIFGKNFRTVRETEDFLTAINDHDKAISTHHLLILHGRYTCKAKRPECTKCNVSHLCDYFNS